MLFSHPIDSLAGAGVILADIWLDNVHMPVIDSLGDEFLEYVKTGMTITVKENGVVELDEERKAAMVSNLLVVLCGNKEAQPIVNSGSLY